MGLGSTYVPLPLELGTPDETETVANPTDAEVRGTLEVGQVFALPPGQLVTVLIFVT